MLKSTTTSSFQFQKDDFVVTAAEPWFKVKVQVIHHYFESFVANVSGRVDDLVVVDLFSRNGFCSTGHQREIFPESMLSLLASQLPVSKWILCEEDPENAKALKVRVNRHFRQKNILIFEQHPSDLIDKFRYYVPQTRGRYKVATLCLVDPFNFKIELSVLEKLAALGFSFLIPYTFTLNNKINYHHYLTE
jgi:three-Cys-motif partner protein